MSLLIFVILKSFRVGHVNFAKTGRGPQKKQG
jgi:hypothetical protein